MLYFFSAMLALKAEREAQQRIDEENFRAAMMAKFAEDDRVEQLNAQRRRMKVKSAGPRTASTHTCPLSKSVSAGISRNSIS